MSAEGKASESKLATKKQPVAKKEGLLEMIYNQDIFPLRKSNNMQGGTYAACLASILMCGALTYLFVTGSLPILHPRVRFLQDRMAMAFAAWKFVSLVFLFLSNAKLRLDASNIIVLMMNIAIDVMILTEGTPIYSGAWTLPIAWSMVAIDGLCLLLTFGQNFISAGLIQFSYSMLGLFLFATSSWPLSLPVNEFQRQFAGYRFIGSLYFGIINMGVPTTIATFAFFVFYLGVDMVIAEDPMHWISEGWNSANWLFAIHGSMTAYHQLAMLMEASSFDPATEGLAPKREPKAVKQQDKKELEKKKDM